jgi:aminopeptidase YwaD
MVRLRLSFLFFILSFVVGSYAQKPQPARADQTEANLCRIIEYLASDKLEGRRTGEPAATAAANYVATQFTNIGLKPGAKAANGRPNYLQPFPYITGVEMAKTGNEFALTVDYLGSRVNIDNAALVRPAGFSPNGAVKDAPVVYAGFGIVSKEPAYDDYTYSNEPLDVKGKVVVVFDGNPDNDNPHSLYGRFDVRTKALIAKEHGAIGLIIISREDKFSDERLAHLGYDQSLGEAAVPTFVVARGLGANVLGVGEDALKTAEGLASLQTQPGVDVRSSVNRMKPTVTFAVNLVKKSVNAYNVIGILPGTDPKLKSEAIVIGAHYDHLGHGGQGSLAANSTEIHHGADDNASGVAAIIELARMLKSEPGAVATGFRNKRTIIFIAFSGEEEGLFGSNFYVNNPVFPLDKTVAMINLDMVGRLKDEKLTIGGVGTASEWRDILALFNNELPVDSMGSSADDIKARTEIEKGLSQAGIEGVKVAVKNKRVYFAGTVKKSLLPMVMKIAQATDVTHVTNAILATDDSWNGRTGFSLQLNEDGFGPSDHSSFYGKKIPVLFFFTGTHNDYHKPSDTADKINYSGEHSVVDYVAAITKAIDRNPQRPAYTVAKTTMQGGRSGFNISLGTIPNYADSTDGLLLDGVRDGSPAAKAGVKAGDKVVKLAGRDIRNVMDYTYVLGEMKAGEEYDIEVLRAGEKLTLKIVPVKR